MTIEEKKNVLDIVCKEQESCYDCHLFNFSKDCNFKSFSDEDIKKAYNLVSDIKIVLIEENKHLKNENAELKKLLKLAIDTINSIECQSSDYCIDCIGSPNICSDMDGFIWKHADEVMKIIGGNENE